MDLAVKLQLKPGQSVAVVNAPDDSALEFAAIRSPSARTTPTL